MNLARCIVFNAMLTNGSARKEMATGVVKVLFETGGPVKHADRLI